MATKFKKGDVVELAVCAPKGPVQALRMLEDGTVECLVAWVDADGAEHQRWFAEDSLAAA
jgi:uncharacterized protein YodC (DUF2158 family)